MTTPADIRPRAAPTPESVATELSIVANSAGLISDLRRVKAEDAFVADRDFGLYVAGRLSNMERLLADLRSRIVAAPFMEKAK